LRVSWNERVGYVNDGSLRKPPFRAVAEHVAGRSPSGHSRLATIPWAHVDPAFLLVDMTMSFGRGTNRSHRARSKRA